VAGEGVCAALVPRSGAAYKAEMALGAKVIGAEAAAWVSQKRVKKDWAEILARQHAAATGAAYAPPSAAPGAPPGGGEDAAPPGGSGGEPKVAPPLSETEEEHEGPEDLEGWW